MGKRAGKPKNHEKRVSYALVNGTSKEGEAIYAMVNRYIEQHHEELTNARMVVAWNLAWKPDADGVVKLGQTKKASDLDRELAPFDFVLLLRKEFWQHKETTDAQREALIDHLLCYGTVALDANHEPKVDERGRRVYRLRRPDLVEFSQIMHRHGCWKRDLENAWLALRTRQMSLLEPLEDKGPSVTAH